LNGARLAPIGELPCLACPPEGCEPGRAGTWLGGLRCRTELGVPLVRRGAASPGQARFVQVTHYRFAASATTSHVALASSRYQSRRGPRGACRLARFRPATPPGSAWQTLIFVATPPLHAGRPAQAVAAKKKRLTQRRAVGAQARQDALKTTRAQVYYPATPKDSASVPVWRLHPRHRVLVEVPSRSC
jgi:hypothetical protein